LPETAEQVCKFVGYDKFLACSSGVEACEAAVKVARRWGYVVKKVPDNQANILMMNGVFWGRSITASGACSDPNRYRQFGPFTPGFSLVDYNDV
jgi:ornithine--oxo-acid transaminase